MQQVGQRGTTRRTMLRGGAAAGAAEAYQSLVGLAAEAPLS